MLEMVLNVVLVVEIVIGIALIIKIGKSVIADHSRMISAKELDMREDFMSIDILVKGYYDNSLVAGFQSRNTIYINTNDSESDMRNTLVHEYVHVWQHNYKFAYKMLCKFIEGFRYGSSIVEKHAYIIGDMYSMCKVYGWSFDESIIPYVWNSLVQHKWDYDDAYMDACMYCKEHYKTTNK